MREGGGNCQNTLKWGGTEKREEDKKIFKKGGQAGSKGGCLKKVGGAGTPLRIMLCGWSLKISLHLIPMQAAFF